MTAERQAQRRSHEHEACAVTNIKSGPKDWAFLVLLCGFAALAPASAADDPNLLPLAARYARNPGCAPVTLPLPQGAHMPLDGDDISPRPSFTPLSQGDSAICFAYATADMISQRVGREISPLDVATKYYFADPSRLGQIGDAALREQLRRMGDWRAAIAASRATMEISRDANFNGMPYADKLEGGEEDIAALLYNIDGLCLEKDLPAYDGYMHFQGYLDLLRVRMRLNPQADYCRVRLAGAGEALQNPATDAFNALWLDRVARQCRRLPLPAPLLPVSFRVAKNEAAFLQMLDENRAPSRADVSRMFAMIDYALDHGRAPAVGYSWFVLEDAKPDDFDPVADHSSIVIGRRKRGGVCHYRVQDNTGEYCAHMRPGIRERCELGRIWLTEQELERTLYSVTYLR